eukprot:386500_1
MAIQRSKTAPPPPEITEHKSGRGNKVSDSKAPNKGNGPSRRSPLRGKRTRSRSPPRQRPRVRRRNAGPVQDRNRPGGRFNARRLSPRPPMRRSRSPPRRRGRSPPPLRGRSPPPLRGRSPPPPRGGRRPFQQAGGRPVSRVPFRPPPAAMHAEGDIRRMMDTPDPDLFGTQVYSGRLFPVTTPVPVNVVTILVLQRDHQNYAEWVQHELRKAGFPAEIKYRNDLSLEDTVNLTSYNRNIAYFMIIGENNEARQTVSFKAFGRREKLNEIILDDAIRVMTDCQGRSRDYHFKCDNSGVPPMGITRKELNLMKRKQALERQREDLLAQKRDEEYRQEAEAANAQMVDVTPRELTPASSVPSTPAQEPVGIAQNSSTARMGSPHIAWGNSPMVISDSASASPAIAQTNGDMSPAFSMQPAAAGQSPGQPGMVQSGGPVQSVSIPPSGPIKPMNIQPVASVQPVSTQPGVPAPQIVNIPPPTSSQPGGPANVQPRSPVNMQPGNPAAIPQRILPRMPPGLSAISMQPRSPPNMQRRSPANMQPSAPTNMQPGAPASLERPPNLAARPVIKRSRPSPNLQPQSRPPLTNTQSATQNRPVSGAQPAGMVRHSSSMSPAVGQSPRVSMSPAGVPQRTGPANTPLAAPQPSMSPRTRRQPDVIDLIDDDETSGEGGDKKPVDVNAISNLLTFLEGKIGAARPSGGGR